MCTVDIQLPEPAPHYTERINERFGEQVCACVVLRPGRQPGEAAAEELRAFCREKISHFKVPKYVHFVEDFPMTVTGKVQKHVLVSKATVALGL